MRKKRSLASQKLCCSVVLNFKVILFCWHENGNIWYWHQRTTNFALANQWCRSRCNYQVLSTLIDYLHFSISMDFLSFYVDCHDESSAWASNVVKPPFLTIKKSYPWTSMYINYHYVLKVCVTLFITDKWFLILSLQIPKRFTAIHVMSIRTCNWIIASIFFSSHSFI